jgi:hypothetical protein
MGLPGYGRPIALRWLQHSRRTIAAKQARIEGAHSGQGQEPHQQDDSRAHRDKGLEPHGSGFESLVGHLNTVERLPSSLDSARYRVSDGIDQKMAVRIQPLGLGVHKGWSTGFPSSSA